MSHILARYKVDPHANNDGSDPSLFNVARDAYRGKISVETGTKALHSEHGLNVNSARDFINDYRLMQQGDGKDRFWPGAL